MDFKEVGEAATPVFQQNFEPIKARFDSPRLLFPVSRSRADSKNEFDLAVRRFELANSEKKQINKKRKYHQFRLNQAESD